ncbi:MAG: HAD hydrolase-like protein [Lentisphaerae bacterium]|jgi:phosphoglycolate phosphatase|nr:HAD hydrolase-like protein [Lentisphaerota bacterium]
MIFTHVFFDLDGTLSDPQLGICGCIQYALRKMGQEHIPERHELHWCIGPALRESFRTLLGDTAGSDDAEQAVAFYRERFADIGLFENELYAGIPEALATLQNDGRRLYLVTAKPIVYAERIIAHFALQPFFQALYGSELDGTFTDKSLLSAEVLRREGIAPDNAVFVGDRRYDIEAAHDNGMPCVAVTYGYGSNDELSQANADAIADAPADIPAAIRALEQRRQQKHANAKIR